MEGKMAFSFCLHFQLTVLVDTVQVVREVHQPVGIMRLDDETVIHTMEAAEGLTGCPVECHFLRVFDEEVGDNKKQW
jgi:hypothetical protein